MRSSSERCLTDNKVIRLAIVFIFLNAFGFPGSYIRVFGNAIKPLIEYTSFFLQLGLMMLTSSDQVMEIKLLDLENRFAPIYFFVLEIGITSMMVTAYRSEQFISCFRVGVTALFAIWLCRNLKLYEILIEAYRAQILFSIASAAFPVLFSAYDERGASYANTFVGINGVKNSAATEFAFGITLLAMLYIVCNDEKRQLPFLYYPVLVFQAVLLFMTQGTGAIFMCLIPVAFSFYAYRKKICHVSVGTMVVAVSVGFLLVAFTIIPLFQPLFDLLGKDATLTGRIPLWNQLIKVIQEQNTMFGYGYGMFWRDPKAVDLMHAGFDENSFMGNMTSGSHNNMIELLINNGIMGVVTFFLCLGASMQHLYKAPLTSRIFVTMHMIFYTIHGLTERGWSNYMFDVLFLFLCMGIACKASSRPQKVQVYEYMPDVEPFAAAPLRREF